MELDNGLGLDCQQFEGIDMCFNVNLLLWINTNVSQIWMEICGGVSVAPLAALVSK